MIFTFINFFTYDKNQINKDEAIAECKKKLRRFDTLEAGPLSLGEMFIEYLTVQKEAYHNRTLGIKNDIDFVKQKISEFQQQKDFLERKTVDRDSDEFLSYVYTTLSSRFEKNISYLNKLLPDEPIDSGEYIEPLSKDQKLVLLYELGVLDFLKSKDCKYISQKDGSAPSVNKIAGILTEFIDSKQATIQPALSKLMSSDGTMTKSNIDSAKNELRVKNVLKKHGLTKKA